VNPAYMWRMSGNAISGQFRVIADAFLHQRRLKRRRRIMSTTKGHIDHFIEKLQFEKI
jgi:hypothetical protein